MSRLRALALEPYYGGSHRAVLDGLVSRIDADWTLLTLPARKWKWRMRGAAITMAREARQASQAHGPAEARAATDVRPAAPVRGARRLPWDVVFASTFLNLAEFRGLAGPAIGSVPAVVYFHENQLVYPNRHTAEWDFQFPLTNITSALSAERCVFNTAWNRDAFLAQIEPFLRQFPDHQPRGVADEIAAKSEVLHAPFDPEPFDEAAVARGTRPRIVWPHRWEHDKNPELFFDAVGRLAAEGLDFEVAVAGQAFRETRESMGEAASVLGDRLVHLGEPEDRQAYAALLASADVAVSTADNEFFGLAMIEASYAGAWPLVPDRLAYPEIYPARFRYRGVDELVARLRSLLLERPEPGAARDIAESYTFERLTPAYLQLLVRTAAAGAGGRP